MTKIKRPPESKDAEEALLGSLLLDPKRLYEVSNMVNVGSFYYTKNSTVYGAILALSESGQPVDIVSISEYLKNRGELEAIGGATYISELMQCVPSATHAKKYAEIVRNKAAFRSLIRSGELITGIGFDEKDNLADSLGEAFKVVQEGVFSLAKGNNGRARDIASIMVGFNKQREEYQSLPEGSLIGIPTGFKDIDPMIDGIRKGHMWIVAGYTNMGKSSLALNIVASLIKQGKRVVFYSLEMGEYDIVSRIAGILSQENGKNTLKKKGTENMEKWLAFIAKADLTIITDLRRMDEISLSMRELHSSKPVDVFFVDYIQQISVPSAKSEYDSMRESASQLQSMGLDLQVPIICVSQVSNEAAKNPKSPVMGFKGAGEIAAVADFAIEIVNGEEDIDTQRRKAMQGLPTRVKILIKKNRHGPTGMTEMDFDGKTGVFQDTEVALEKEFFGKKDISAEDVDLDS